MIVRLTIIVLALGQAVLQCFAADPPGPPPTDPPACRAAPEDLLAAVRAVHEKQHNVGLSALIRSGTATTFQSHLGMADLEHDVAVGSETRFSIASITKLVTAATLLRFHERGTIDLDHPVQHYLPDFPEKPEGEITLRMLVTHTSGLPHPRDRTPKLYATHYESATDALVVFADSPLLFAPGSDAAYSSSNYNLLAAIMEQVAEGTFQDIVQREVFTPLELANTSFDDVLRPLPHRSRRYSFYHPWTYAESDRLFVVPTWDYSFNLGGGGLISTASDVASFATALTEPGLLSAASLDLLGSEAWFGSGERDGHIFVSGANPGVQAGLSIDRTSGLVAVVLSNTWGIGSRSAEMSRLADLLARRCAGIE